MKKIIAALFAVALAFPVHAQQERKTVVRNDLEKHFKEIGTNGTFVLLDQKKSVVTVVNGDRYTRGFLPASTFKIANALIALETRVLADADSRVFKWDGKKRDIEAWNTDHTLRSGFKASAVWVFQEIAREIGEQRMRVYLTQFGYGNRDAGGEIDSFWLEGKLRISALQQIEFLERLLIGKLPVNPRSVEVVKDIAFVEKIGNATLRGKTGWIPSGDNKIGWFVGWVERDGNTYIFALNLDPNEERHVAARVAITKALLTALGALPRQ